MAVYKPINKYKYICYNNVNLKAYPFKYNI